MTKHNQVESYLSTIKDINLWNSHIGNWENYKIVATKKEERRFRKVSDLVLYFNDFSLGVEIIDTNPMTMPRMFNYMIEDLPLCIFDIKNLKNLNEEKIKKTFEKALTLVHYPKNLKLKKMKNIKSFHVIKIFEQKGFIVHLKNDETSKMILFQYDDMSNNDLLEAKKFMINHDCVPYYTEVKENNKWGINCSFNPMLSWDNWLMFQNKIGVFV